MGSSNIPAERPNAKTYTVALPQTRNPIQQTVGAHRRLRSDATTAPRDYLMMNFR